nr:hypothetical protein [uncultured Acetobacterium sp.]
MDLGMLVIVAVIVIPGYFMVNYLTKALYSQSNMMDESVEDNHRKQSLESEINEDVGESKENHQLKNPQLHNRAKKKIVKLNKKSDSPVIIKYRKQAKNKR